MKASDSELLSVSLPGYVPDVLCAEDVVPP